MLPLLVHSQAVSPAARSALQAAHESPPEARLQALESAAKVLHAETGLECRDALEILGLRGADSSCA